MKLIREIAAGSIASSTTASIFSPLECVKTRMQVQMDPTADVLKIYNRGFGRALVSIFKTDGLLLTWSHGFVGFVGRDFLYSGLRIGCYPTVRALYAGHGTDKADVSLLTKIAAGATTGAVGSVVANPFDVVRVRMTVEGGKLDQATGRLASGMKEGRLLQYRSSLHCMTSTIRRDGVRGLYRGVEATAARAALLSAGQLASYDHSKTLLIRGGWLEEGNVLHVVAAVISGLVATTVCNPADVLKSRLMVERSGGSSKVSSIVQQIWRSEGWIGFMRGWGPAYARAGPAFFIQMPIVEGLRIYFGVGSL
jgi:hypothetical protein